MNLSSVNEDQWRWVAVGGAGVGGGLSAVLAYSATGEIFSGAVVGFLIGFALFANLIRLVGSVNLKLGRLHQKLDRLHRRVSAAEAEIQATVNIRPLLGNTVLSFGEWALPADTCERLSCEIRSRTPNVIVECGSGISTVLMATCLQTYNIDGHIISLEHKARFAQATRDLLKHAGVSDLATVISAPLTDHDVDGQCVRWYDFVAQAHLDVPIDLLVVDGPPGSSGPMARWPAVPVLREHLAPDCFILIDDGHRPDERKAAQDWAERLGVDATLSGRWRPYFVLESELSP